MDTHTRVKVNTLNPCFSERGKSTRSKQQKRTPNKELYNLEKRKEKKMNSNGRTPISISNIESSLEAMTRRLESSSSSGSKVRGNL